MKKIGIIGYGTIAATYIKSLEHLKEYYQLCGIYDINPTKAKQDLSGITTIYETLDDLLSSDLDCVIISTPIHTHFNVSSKCMNAKKDVILEKPATISMSELKSLFAIAKENSVRFYVAFHSSFAVDIEWYLSHQDTLEPCYHIDNIKELECGFYDPYMENCKIYEDRASLCGSYIDSGVNILSVCNRFISLDGFVVEKHATRVDENNVVYSSDTIYLKDDKKIIMHTGWDKGLNQKRTLLTFKDIEQKILLDHSNQCVKLILNDEETILYQEISNERLVNHYIAVFKDFLEITDLLRHENDVLNIHELLLNRY